MVSSYKTGQINLKDGWQTINQANADTADDRDWRSIEKQTEGA